MILRSHKRFDKQFQQLSPKLQQKVKATLQQFTENPHERRLRNHALRGALEGKRAISVTSNIRILFKEEGTYKYVTILDVGTHNQVY